MEREIRKIPLGIGRFSELKRFRAQKDIMSARSLIEPTPCFCEDPSLRHRFTQKQLFGRQSVGPVAPDRGDLAAPVGFGDRFLLDEVQGLLLNKDRPRHQGEVDLSTNEEIQASEDLGMI